MENEALTVNASTNFIHLVPYEMTELLYWINSDASALLDLTIPAEEPEDEIPQDIQRTISANYMIAWNSSKQIGAWIGKFILFYHSRCTFKPTNSGHNDWTTKMWCFILTLIIFHLSRLRTISRETEE